MKRAASHSLPVLRGEDFPVISGANLGDGLTEASELMLDDVYHLASRAARHSLKLADIDGDRQFRVSAGSEAGVAGRRVMLDSALTFMCPDGATVEALVFVELTEDGMVAACWLLPLAALASTQDYALVAVDRDGARAKLAEVACVSFVRGTQITLADGMQVPIETLKVGDRVLTRDNGPQQVRWIGSQTVRATGSFAPITIAAGALNNSGDLTVSPNHRLFIYQRQDHAGAGRAEVLVRARNLVNGETVVQSDGGFVDYFQLMFDEHEIIYAEGIAAESLLVDTRVRPVIPAELRGRLAGGMEDLGGGIELEDGAMDASAAAELLRRASAC